MAGTDPAGTGGTRTGLERALRESDQRFQQLARHIDSVFYSMSLDPGEILYVSPAYERVWGTPLHKRAARIRAEQDERSARLRPAGGRAGVTLVD